MTKRIFALFLCAVTVAFGAASLCSVARADEADRVTVVLDPGHGGKDVGSMGTKYEYYYNLKVAEACAEKLRKNGNFNVYLTRTTNEEELSLLERGVFADSVNADVLVSIHFNWFTDKDFSGVEAYASVLDRFDLSALAKSAVDKIAAATGLKARGVSRTQDTEGYYWDEEHQWDVQSTEFSTTLSDYYGIITFGAKFGIPTIIVEHAFLSNEKDLKIADKDDNLKKMGEADADALIEYYTGHKHVYGGEATVDYPTSCCFAGKRSYHCTVCGHRKDVEALAEAPDPEAHFWVERELVPATCVDAGVKEVYCRYERNLADKGMEGVADNSRRELIPALGHDFESTKLEDGTTVVACTRCGALPGEDDTEFVTETDTGTETAAEIAVTEKDAPEDSEGGAGRHVGSESAVESSDKEKTYKLIAIVASGVAAAALIAVAVLAVMLVKSKKAPVIVGEEIALSPRAEDLLYEVGLDPAAPVEGDRDAEPVPVAVGAIEPQGEDAGEPTGDEPQE